MDTETFVKTEIFKNLSFSSKEIDLISNKFEKIVLKKGSILLKSGEKVTNQYYVAEGCLRTFFLNDSGKEYTLQFAIKGWWISDFTAVFDAGKAIMNIECIQEAVLYKISRKNMNLLFTETEQLNTFFRLKLENAFANFQKRILESLSLSAKERYVSFINKYPTIEKSVKNYHIASYLGITTESLSRIRKDLTTK